MNDFLKQWGEAAYTSTGFFWMALWAFVPDSFFQTLFINSGQGNTDSSQVKIQDSEYFKIDYTFYLNLAFLAISGYLVPLGFFKKKDVAHSMSEIAPKSELLENILKYTAFICYIWLAGGLMVQFFNQ